MDASCNLYGEASLWTADSSVTRAGPVVLDRAIDPGGMNQMRELGLGWTSLIVANSPGGDGVEEFEEGYMAGQWGVVQNYSAGKYPSPLVLVMTKKRYTLTTLQAVPLAGWVFLVVWIETLEYLMVLTQVLPQSSLMLVTDLAMAFY